MPASARMAVASCHQMLQDISAPATMVLQATHTWKKDAKVSKSNSTSSFQFILSYLCVGIQLFLYCCMLFADIDECSLPDQYPCYGTCSNTNGDYSCSCKSGTQSIDPKRETCKPIAVSERARLTKMFIGNLHILKIFQ
jgi:hypothetical protein